MKFSALNYRINVNGHPVAVHKEHTGMFTFVLPVVDWLKAWGITDFDPSGLEAYEQMRVEQGFFPVSCLTQNIFLQYFGDMVAGLAYLRCAQDLWRRAFMTKGITTDRSYAAAAALSEANQVAYDLRRTGMAIDRVDAMIQQRYPDYTGLCNDALDITLGWYQLGKVVGWINRSMSDDFDPRFPLAEVTQ